ncbi:hypothetical protein OG21DRAFT_1489310 [Imleria badia]|nr:hypothetical protein OG21DRAFT_1489310 [Imleria badia]
MPREDPTPEQQATADGEEDDLDGFEQEYKASPRHTKWQDTNKSSSPAQASRTPQRAPPVVEEEEEHSLLEPRVRPQTQSQPPPVEEVKGPREIGPFHKSFSPIVGPNGSGKSNTIDAFLFVFGYRAPKMRQGKLSELIHNSARYPDLDDCSVEPGPDAYQVVPNSQLVVARIAYKNNSSKYMINGCASNFTEVQTLLKGRGIDLDHKRFLILQGEVESITQMKPKAQNEHEDGLLECLEDIVGTSSYKTPIEEALAQVETLTDQRSEKLSRLRIVEREKNVLEAQRKEALDYLQLENNLVKAKSRLWQRYLWKCLENEARFNVQIAKYQKEDKSIASSFAP